MNESASPDIASGADDTAHSPNDDKNPPRASHASEKSPSPSEPVTLKPAESADAGAPVRGEPRDSGSDGATDTRSGGAAGECSTGASGATSGPDGNAGSGSGPGGGSGSGPGAGSAGGNRNRRRLRGGRGRNRSAGARQSGAGQAGGPTGGPAADRPDALPKPEREGRASAADAEAGLVRTPAEEARSSGGAAGPGSAGSPAQGGGSRPRIGDTRPAPASGADQSGKQNDDKSARTSTSGGKNSSPSRKRRRRGGRGRSGGSNGERSAKDGARGGRGGERPAKGRQPEGVRSGVAKPVTALTGGGAIELDEEVLEERRGKTRNGKAVGRYLMAVHVQPEATQIAILEGRSLIEHYVARPTDDITQIHGNIYLGRVQNVLPGMEAAFIDIGTPKNAVLYRGDLHFDPEDLEEHDNDRIEEVLRAKQTVLCQVTKNPIMHKGARLTQEVSLPGRFVVLVPNSRTVGISKRLPDAERKRLRKVVDGSRPEGHGVIVRTAAEGITAPEIERDLARLVSQWNKIDALARKASAPALLYREPDMALRVIREEFSRDFRAVEIDDKAIFEDVHDYVASVSPAMAERVSHFDTDVEDLALFERHHIAEQLRRALDRKVWLPSGGSLIIEHTEALTVIDVNTGKNVGTSSLEDTVFHNNLEAATEIARQLRLRDVGGIIVIDFVDMEVRKNRAEVVRVFREALARDKTRTQVFDISELGLVQMTRKRIGEGLLESFSEPCATCEGRGVVFDKVLLED